MPIVSLFDPTVEEVLETLEAAYFSIKVKAAKETRYSIPSVLVEGSSSTGCLGLGDDVTKTDDVTALSLLRNRTVISLACGDHHVICLVAACSCSNPFTPDFQCKEEACNDGYEVFGWGENFLGQAVGDTGLGNFIASPFNVKYCPTF